MGCAPSSLNGKKNGRKRSPSGSPKKQPSKLQQKEQSSSRKLDKSKSGKSEKEKQIQRLLSANTGTVFRLGHNSAKGVETRLRRLSAPAIKADGTPYSRDSSPSKRESSPTKRDSSPSKKVDTAVRKESIPEEEAEAEQPVAAGSSVVPVLAAAGSSSTRVRRMSVLGAPPNAPVDDSSGDGAADGTNESPTRRVYTNPVLSSSSRSSSGKHLADFNLMESVIHSVATLSRAGREPSYRKTNQDNCFAYQQYLFPSQALFGTMDGHGPNGHKVSAFIKKELPVTMAKQQEEQDDAGQALKTTFLATQAALESSTVDCEYSGSTCVVSYLLGRKLTTAWVGDSRAVLCRQGPRGLKGISLTKDHKPAAVEEKQRILAAGGRVDRLTDTRGQPIGPARVWLQKSWVPGLAMSRAMGDMVAHSVGVTAEPDINVTDITPMDRFLILASDGVWEFIQCQDAAELIAGCQSAEQACRLLVDASHDRWVEEEDGVVDDITVVVVKFK